MNLSVNGSKVEAEEAVTVASLIDRVAPGRGGLGTAVALNGEVVPKGEWASTALRDGDRVEVLHARGGG